MTAIWKYRLARALGRLTVEMAAMATFRRMPPMVSAAAIVEAEGRILVIRDTAQGMIVLPGGHLRWDESVEEGLRREVREETGLEVEPVTLQAVLASSSGFSDRGIIRVIWEARITGGKEQSSPEGAVEWVSLASLNGEKARDAEIIRQWLRTGGLRIDHTGVER